jgi:hypothetical protein
MNDKQLIATLQRAGFKGNGLRTAYAIAHRESGGRPDAFNPNTSTGDQSYGLFQINMLGGLGPARRQQFGIAKNEDLFNPMVNAKAAFDLSKGGTDFGAWGVGPNAYRAGAGMDTIQGYYDRFPGALQSPRKALANQPTGPRTVRASQAQIKVGGQAFGGGGTSPQQRLEASTGGQDFKQVLAGFLLQRGAAMAAGENPQGGILELAQLRQQMMQQGALPTPGQGAQGATGAGTGAVASARVDAGTQIDGGSTTPTPGMGTEAQNVSGIQKDILAAAHAQVGQPYVWGAESRSEGGFDCSGLIDYAYRAAGINPPGRMTTDTIAKLGKSVKGQPLQPGDAVLIGSDNHHVVMYVGDGKVIAAPHTGTVVQYQPLSRFDGEIHDVRRLIP